MTRLRNNHRNIGRTIPTLDLERDLAEKGYGLIAGADEAGRGALAGPLAVGLVVFRPALFSSIPPELGGVRDSKKLTPRKRQELIPSIIKHAEYAGTIMVSHRCVDRLNVNGATEYALAKLLSGLSRKPDILIMDGTFRFSLEVPFRAVKGGDSLSLTIAAASILAKVRRDGILMKFHSLYPPYGFDRNKGYGTGLHREALLRNGPSPVHRVSYEPLKGMLEGEAPL